MSGPFSTSTAPYDICLRIFVTILALKSTVPLTKKVWVGVEGQVVLFPRSGISLGVHLFGRIQKRICESLSRVDSLVPLMWHDPNDLRSQIRFRILLKKRTLGFSLISTIKTCVDRYHNN